MFIILRVGSLFAADKRRNYVFLCIHHSLATSDVTIAPAISSDHCSPCHQHWSVVPNTIRSLAMMNLQILCKILTFAHCVNV